MKMALLAAAALLWAPLAAADGLPGFDAGPEVENRTLRQLHAAALREGGVVTLWHGGDERSQADNIKREFEKRFCNMTLNVTVDLSKYLDGRIDEQLAAGSVYVDSVILQSVHDYPRWAREGALLPYAPLGFEHIYPAFKDSLSAAYYGIELFNWMNLWNPQKLPDANFDAFEEYLRPEYKDKIVLTYPNDDDAVLFAFKLIMDKRGEGWFRRLQAQNPRWVRGTATPLTLARRANSSLAASFTSTDGFARTADYNFTFPTDAQFVSWPQTAAILRDAPHPEGAKLLHSWMLTPDFQSTVGWSVRQDVPGPDGYPKIVDMPDTDPTAFPRFMSDRVEVERLRNWFEDQLGPPVGPSPLEDDI